MNEILRLSDDASLLFSVGRIHEASASWHGVIRRLLPLVTSDLKENDLLSTTATPATTIHHETVVPVPLRGSFVVIPVASAIEGALPSSSLSKLTLQDRTFALHASAIHYSLYVPPQWGVRGLDDDDDDDIISIMALAATAVYNLGLCHHLQSILDESRATEHCRKALRAYKASLRILREGSGLSVVAPPPNRANDVRPDDVHYHYLGVSLLQLAIVNNLGHIHDLLHDRHEAHHQLVELHRLVASLHHHHHPQCYGYDNVDAGAGAGHRGGRPFVLNDDSTATAPFVPFLLTAALYHPFLYRHSLPAPCA